MVIGNVFCNEWARLKNETPLIQDNSIGSTTDPCNSGDWNFFLSSIKFIFYFHLLLKDRFYQNNLGRF